MKKIKTAIIGCGKVGHLHAKALAEMDNAELVAVYDSDIARADAYAENYSAVAFNSIEKMVKDAGVEVAVVCSPHPLHRDCSLPALNAGAHVIVEKPLASTLRDCDDIIETAKKNNLIVGTISQRRFYRPCMRIRDAIDAGKLGKPVLGTVTMHGWRDENYYNSDPWRGSWKHEGGGVLVNQAPHQIDLLLWYMGEVDTVYGAWANLNHPYIEVEDTAIAVIRFKSGALGNIVVSNSQNPALYGNVHVFGSNGAAAGVQTDGGAMFIAGMSSITEPPVNDMWTVPGEEGRPWNKEDSDFFLSIDFMNYYHERQIEDFLRAVLNGTRPLITGQDGRKTVEIFTAIYRSNRDRAPVKFPLVAEQASDTGVEHA